MVETTHFAFDPRGFSANRWIPGSTLKNDRAVLARGRYLKLESVSEDPLSLRQPYTTAGNGRFGKNR